MLLGLFPFGFFSCHHSLGWFLFFFSQFLSILASSEKKRSTDMLKILIAIQCPFLGLLAGSLEEGGGGCGGVGGGNGGWLVSVFCNTI